MVSPVRTPQQMKCVLTAVPGLHPPAPPNYSLFIIVIILQEVGHIRSDGTPRRHSRVTQRKILKILIGSRLLNSGSCFLRPPAPAPNRCPREPPRWWWRAAQSSTMTEPPTRKTRRMRRLVSVRWTFWATTVSLTTQEVCCCLCGHSTLLSLWQLKALSLV